MDNIPQLIEDEILLYERNLYHFLVGLFNYKNGDKAGGKAIMDQAIQIYEWLGCRNLADNYKKDLEKYNTKNMKISLAVTHLNEYGMDLKDKALEKYNLYTSNGMTRENILKSF